MMIIKMPIIARVRGYDGEENKFFNLENKFIQHKHSGQARMTIIFSIASVKKFARGEKKAFAFSIMYFVLRIIC